MTLPRITLEDIMDIYIDSVGKVVMVNGHKYMLADCREVEKSEIVTIKEVCPRYTKKQSSLYLKFDIPLMKFSPGDKIRIIKEGL